MTRVVGARTGNDRRLLDGARVAVVGSGAAAGMLVMATVGMAFAPVCPDWAGGAVHDDDGTAAGGGTCGAALDATTAGICTDGADTATLNLIGQYAATDFRLSGDAGGGTLVQAQPATGDPPTLMIGSHHG